MDEISKHSIDGQGSIQCTYRRRLVIKPNFVALAGSLQDFKLTATCTELGGILASVLDQLIWSYSVMTFFFVFEEDTRN